MRDSFDLLGTLDRLFEGARESVLTLDEFLEGLQGRSYPFAILALNIPNCIPTGIPWLSTITGLPMVVLLIQFFAGRAIPSLPKMIGQRGLSRSKLQDFLNRARRYLAWLESTVRTRNEWWVGGTPRRLLLIAWSLNIVLLALPIPFDNLLPAWAILFFCLGLIEDDGLMAMIGWAFTVLTAIWTVFLLMAGQAAIRAALSTFRDIVFG